MNYKTFENACEAQDQAIQDMVTVINTDHAEELSNVLNMYNTAPKSFWSGTDYTEAFRAFCKLATKAVGFPEYRDDECCSIVGARDQLEYALRKS